MAFLAVDYALSQVTYPGAGDVDDCWVVATCWAARRTQPGIALPSVPVFRAAAGNPDDPNRSDGGTLAQIMQGCLALWPQMSVDKFVSSDTAKFLDLLKRGWTASLAVLSSELPYSMQFVFKGGHQVGVMYKDGAYWLMNPLQKNGAAPLKIGSDQLLRAARAFNGGTLLAAMFPPANEVISMAFVINFQRFNIKAGTPFYESPGGVQIGTIGSDAVITVLGMPLDRSTDTSPGRNAAWRAVLVRSDAMDKVQGWKVVYMKTAALVSEVPTTTAWDTDLVTILRDPAKRIGGDTAALDKALADLKAAQDAKAAADAAKVAAEAARVAAETRVTKAKALAGQIGAL